MMAVAAAAQVMARSIATPIQAPDDRNRNRRSQYACSHLKIDDPFAQYQNTCAVSVTFNRSDPPHTHRSTTAKLFLTSSAALIARRAAMRAAHHASVRAARQLSARCGRARRRTAALERDELAEDWLEEDCPCLASDQGGNEDGNLEHLHEHRALANIEVAHTAEERRACVHWGGGRR